MHGAVPCVCACALILNLVYQHNVFLPKLNTAMTSYGCSLDTWDVRLQGIAARGRSEIMLRALLPTHITMQVYLHCTRLGTTCCLEIFLNVPNTLKSRCQHFPRVVAITSNASVGHCLSSAICLGLLLGYLQLGVACVSKTL